MSTLIRKKYWLLLLAIGVFLGTSPRPPYHVYEIRGQLLQIEGNTPDGLYVMIYSESEPGVYRPVESTDYNDYPVGMTDSAGYFFLRATSRYSTESIRLGFFNTHVPSIYTEPMGIPDSITTAEYDYVPALDDEAEFLGCNCSTDYTYQVVGFTHRWVDYTCILPPGAPQP